MRAWVLLSAVLFSPLALAWEFEPPLTVAAAREGVFHHLEAAGRASLAVNGSTVGLVWEDNRRGQPGIFVALKDGKNFGEPLQVSGGGSAYEPAIAALGAGGFVLAWEEDERIHVRALQDGTLGPVTSVDSTPGRQASLAAAPEGGFVLAWIRRQGPEWVMTREGRVRDGAVRLGKSRPAEADPPEAEKLFPSVVATGAGVAVAWEDRRHGHTRLFHAFAEAGSAYGEVRQLNELLPSRSADFGRGTGVTRVALASGPGEQVAAIWMDKREFEGGYKVYAALSRNGGRDFTANEKVQDVFGDTVPQWHPAIALAPDGTALAAWDDRRDESSDVWLSWRSEQGWSDDLAAGPAYGPGEQSHPVLAFDRSGALHMAWVVRTPKGQTEIRYATARR